MTRIAAMARDDGVSVAPHNPSGPVSTAASVQVCAGMANFRILELQWGETAWRGELVVPEERFEKRLNTGYRTSRLWNRAERQTRQVASGLTREVRDSDGLPVPIRYATLRESFRAHHAFVGTCPR